MLVPTQQIFCSIPSPITHYSLLLKTVRQNFWRENVPLDYCHHIQRHLVDYSYQGALHLREFSQNISEVTQHVETKHLKCGGESLARI